jgi:hypothetical protein
VLISVTSSTRRLAGHRWNRYKGSLSVLRHLQLPSDSAVKHATECDTINRAGMDTEPYDPARILIHDNQDSVATQRRRLAPEQIQTPDAVFRVAEEREPGWAARIRFRSVMRGYGEPHPCRLQRRKPT